MCVLIDQPYKFIAPYRGRFWYRILGPLCLPSYLRRLGGVDAVEFRGVEYLEASLAARQSIILAPNHPRPCDALPLGLLSLRLSQPFYALASWHVFRVGRLRSWLMRRAGCFSLHRESLDWQALEAATTILTEAERPLVYFPEGTATRTNNRLGHLQRGIAFLAREAARRRAESHRPGQVMVHPVALRYLIPSDPEPLLRPILEDLEASLPGGRRIGMGLLDRVRWVGESLLRHKEVQYLGRTQTGPRRQRVDRLLEHLLTPLEAEWLRWSRPAPVIERVKRLRMAMVPTLLRGTLSPAEQNRRRQQLDVLQEVYLLSRDAGDDLEDRPSAEQLLETLERHEETFTGRLPRVPHGLRVVVQVGPALPVTATTPSSGLDPLLPELHQRLQDMLDGLQSLCRPLTVSPTALHGRRAPRRALAVAVS